MGRTGANNVTWDHGLLKREDRWQSLSAGGATVWFTGLSGSGKSTIAAALEHFLVSRSVHAFRLDGDNIRHGLNADLGFSAPDRAENIRRIGEVVALFAESGCIAVASFISPYAKERNQVRALHDERGLRFFEVFVNTPLAVCEARDPKGLYKRSRAGNLPGFTGIDAPYEVPESPALILNTQEQDVSECVKLCADLLSNAGVVPAALEGG